MAGIAAGAGAAVVAILGSIAYFCYKHVHPASKAAAPLLPTTQTGANNVSQDPRNQPSEEMKQSPGDTPTQKQTPENGEQQTQAQPDQIDRPEHPPRVPRYGASEVEKHHHHPHPGSHQVCLDANCELNDPDHSCHPHQVNTCPCTCRIEKCPETERRRTELLQKDLMKTVVSGML